MSLSTSTGIDVTSFSAGLIADSTAPAKPTGFSISSVFTREGFSLVTFSWDKNVESDLSSYKLVASDIFKIFEDIKIDAGNKTSVNLEMANFTRIEAYVKAYDTSANGSNASTTLKFEVGQEQSSKQNPDVFRFYNEKTGVHFYTASVVERDNILADIPEYKYEGNAFDVKLNNKFLPPRDQFVTVWRFYNKDTGTHFYTASESEAESVKFSLHQYVYEGEAYKAFKSNEMYDAHPLHRFYNTQTGTHFYTDNEIEKHNVELTLPQYKYEGIAYYVAYA